MISGIDVGAMVDYILKDDKENPTVWKLGVLPSSLLGKISAQGVTDPMESVYLILRAGLKGWQNFGGLEYKTIKETICGRELDILSMELLDKIPLNIATELSTEILKLNKISVPEQKN